MTEFQLLNYSIPSTAKLVFILHNPTMTFWNLDFIQTIEYKWGIFE